MKHAAPLFLFLSVLLFAGSVHSADTVRMGYFNLPPYQYSETGGDVAHPAGAQVAYIEAVASKMGYDVEWVGPIPLARLTEYLKSGVAVDGTVGFPRSSNFETFLYYLEKPIYSVGPVLCVRSDNSLTEVRSIEDIRGYRIGLVKTLSGRYTPLIDDHLDALYLEDIGGDDWMEQNLKKLLVERIDAVFDRQRYTIDFVARQMGVTSQIRVLPIPDSPTDFYIVFSKSSENGAALTEQFNAALLQEKIDFTALLQKEIATVPGGK